MRVLSCALLLIVLAAVKFPSPQTGHEPEGPATESRWEYKAHRIDARQCSSEQEVAALLNAAGQQGWELVSYERLASPLPKEADGTLLIKNAATGPGRANNPQTADSLEGKITMKLADGQPSPCRLLLKRQAHPAAKP
jgi:hypothetical protein